jgi:hypothetical protein
MIALASLSVDDVAQTVRFLAYLIATHARQLVRSVSVGS